MSYCNEKNQAIVSYLKNKKITKFNTNQVPIEVEIISKKDGSYRFYGIGDDSLFYEFIASGINPGYAINSGFNNRGVTPTMNGVFLKSQSYYYVSGYGIETLVEPINECQIKVTTPSQIFTDSIDCPGVFEVSCDDDCPTGHHKCKHNKYPGYCCVPCKKVGNRIKNIASKVRG
ncbi:hypothetical protein [Nostoc linckia]|uniref:Uncharacterized protein n=2 Tax=Nostoc linckia TaxID=92942 RepID=A0A9Q5Z6C7_NOSLI|nr:hypothetical protein [Nostoc linckia]PHJ62644.1 hypothetical protein VF05_26075 [Nostoc linckia z3]PHJ68796.1 hypothetical protein VF03_24345 [Nostoc linckia z2]PHJ79604.1 hypothetical protein VF07_33750 [Nostoc linckia z6]PHJ95762.1 hypothetical protein VF08_31275 [Nostoc linckia z8]